MFGFLYLGYSRKRYYWESVVLLHKLGMVIVVAFVVWDPVIQIQMAMWLNLGFLIATMLAKPFIHPSVHKADVLSKMSTVILLNLLMVYGDLTDTTESTESSATVLIAIEIAGSVLMFATTLYFMYLLMSHTAPYLRTLLNIPPGRNIRFKDVKAHVQGLLGKKEKHVEKYKALEQWFAKNTTDKDLVDPIYGTEFRVRYVSWPVMLASYPGHAAVQRLLVSGPPHM